MITATKSRPVPSGTGNDLSAATLRVAHNGERNAHRSPDAPSADRQLFQNTKKHLRVMKFGGTSVGDASCIQKVIAIIFSAIQESDVVVVVSAMSGVTNKLLEAAVRAESGDAHSVALIFADLRALHLNTANALLSSRESQNLISDKMENILDGGEQLCHETIRTRELTLRAQDSISSVGERLSALLLSAALAEYDLASEAVDAVDLIVTDSFHGAAEPQMALTQQRSHARLRPLLDHGIIPVVTGFIGATPDGVLTTLGRGGSDYSATILAAALAANEVIIWTDVNGVLTVDPRLVSGASTIPELSYREATELAYFGAKVLHSKTMRPVMQSGIPLWIRNTFAPHQSGTRVTPTTTPNAGGIKALTAVRDVARITVGGPCLAGARDILVRTFSALAEVRAEVLMIFHSSSQNDIGFVVPATVAKASMDALLSEFSKELDGQGSDHITIDSTVAIIAVVGEKMGGFPMVAGRIFRAMNREKLGILAVAHGSTDCTIAFLVSARDTKAALAAAHREFQLHALDSPAAASATANEKATITKRMRRASQVSPRFKKSKRKSTAS